MNKEQMEQKVKAATFRVNNGQVLRTINILREKYNQLEVVQSVVEDNGVDVGEFIDSINFLSMEGYISLRKISDHCNVDISDANYKECEAKVTGKGIRLLAGGICDNMIEI